MRTKPVTQILCLFGLTVASDFNKTSMCELAVDGTCEPLAVPISDHPQLSRRGLMETERGEIPDFDMGKLFHALIN